MPPDEPNDEERQEELPEDNGTPFQPADQGRDDAAEPDSDRQEEGEQLDDTHPSTDSILDPQELYDEGVSGAAEANEPNAGNEVVDFDAEAEADENE